MLWCEGWNDFHIDNDYKNTPIHPIRPAYFPSPTPFLASTHTHTHTQIESISRIDSQLIIYDDATMRSKNRAQHKAIELSPP
jgi:hypothetical protein